MIALPCANSTGPKVKLIEALGFGVAVVATTPGVEGIVLKPRAGGIVTDEETFACALTKTLRSPELQGHLGATGRTAGSAHRCPEAFAYARLRAFNKALDRV